MLMGVFYPSSGDAMLCHQQQCESNKNIVIRIKKGIRVCVGAKSGVSQEEPLLHIVHENRQTSGKAVVKKGKMIMHTR